MENVSNGSRSRHVVFGAGQIGPRLADALAARGHAVRVVRRSARPVGEHEVVSGDARDAAFARRASEGGAALYHCMNPSAYRGRAWEEELPAMMEALIDAALANDARLVVLDNLYAYGPTEGARTEATRLAASGRKGRVRARCAQMLERARDARGLRYVVGRAGDFFGPDADEALVSPAAVQGIAAGARPLALGDPDAPHAFSFTDDVVQALARLGDAPDVEGEVFHLPVHVVSPRELYARIGARFGVTARPRRLGRLVLWLLWPFASLFRELLETLYQWDRPFLVDDARFRARFPDVGVTLEEAIDGTVAAAQGSSTEAQGGSKASSSQSAALPSL